MRKRVKQVGRKLLIPSVIAVIILAAALRLWGIEWGLPTARHYFSYHPDETLVLLAAMKVNPLAGALDPGFYNYGSLYIYLVNIAMFAATLTGMIQLPDDIFSNIGEFAKLYMAGRFVAAALGIATVYLVYTLGRRAYGREVGLLAALFMAITPLHVMHSKFLAVDVPATFFVTLALVFAIRITDGHRLRDYLLSGLFAGLAAGTKYNAGLVILAPIIAHLTTAETRPILRIFSLKLASIPLLAAAGFLIGTPGALLNYDAFSRDFTYEIGHVRIGHGLVFTHTAPGFIHHVTDSLWPGMGLPLLVLAAIGILWAVRRHNAADVALLAFAVAYYIVIGAAQVKFARYTMPLLPVLALLAARIWVELSAHLRSGGAASRFIERIFLVLLILIVGYTTLYAVSLDRMMASKDPRDRAADWIKANIPLGVSICLPTIPWFYTPPLDPYFGLPDARDRYERMEEMTDYILIASRDTEWDAAFLARESPDYVVMSDYEYGDRKRIHDKAAAEYFAMLGRDYRLERRFFDAPSLWGQQIPLLRKLPHDMSYASPTILIYSRKAMD